MSSRYSLGEFAKRIGRSVPTVRRWEREGKLQAKRLPSGHRYCDASDVRFMLGGAPKSRDAAVYCRVSGAGQKDDLASPVRAMETDCLGAGIAVDERVQEIGGGMNVKRKRFLALVDRIRRGEVRWMPIAHKDRLMRFGFDPFAHIAEENGCEIVVVNQDSLSPEQERVEDLLAIVQTFSCRLYGMRKYEQHIKEDYADMPIQLPKDACA